MRTFKLICTLILFAIAAVFIYQNTAVIQLHFLFWSASLPACLMLLLALFTGIIIGILLSFLSARTKAGKHTKEHIKSFQ